MERFLIRTCVVIPDVSVGMRHVDGMNGSETLGLQDMPCMRSFVSHLGCDGQIDLKRSRATRAFIRNLVTWPSSLLLASYFL